MVRQTRSEGFRRAARSEAQYLQRIVETQARLGKPRLLRTTYSSVNAPEFLDAIRATFPGFSVTTEYRESAVAITIAAPHDEPAVNAGSLTRDPSRTR